MTKDQILTKECAKIHNMNITVLLGVCGGCESQYQWQFQTLLMRQQQMGRYSSCGMRFWSQLLAKGECLEQFVFRVGGSAATFPARLCVLEALGPWFK